MPNLKDLKTRIDSVKSTRKITKAMQMVAAAKLRRAQEAAEAGRPYADRMNAVMANLAGSASGADNAPKLLSGSGESQIHLLVVATAERGLCGGFNSSIAKLARAKAEELIAAGKTVKILTIGKKGREQLKRDLGDKMVDHVDLSEVKNMGYSHASQIASDIVSRFNSGEFDVATIFYNKLGEVEVLADLLPRALSTQVFTALLENGASEQGARMSAMDNATRNAGDMIDKLTIVYNRSRQAAITNELIEIISGAEAL